MGLGDSHVVMGILVPCAYQSMVRAWKRLQREASELKKKKPLSTKKRQREKKGQASSNSLCHGGQMTIKQDQLGLCGPGTAPGR